jgi:hypothetical protein
VSCPRKRRKARRGHDIEQRRWSAARNGAGERLRCGKGAPGVMTVERPARRPRSRYSSDPVGPRSSHRLRGRRVGFRVSRALNPLWGSGVQVSRDRSGGQETARLGREVTSRVRGSVSSFAPSAERRRGFATAAPPMSGLMSHEDTVSRLQGRKTLAPLPGTTAARTAGPGRGPDGGR